MTFVISSSEKSASRETSPVSAQQTLIQLSRHGIDVVGNVGLIGILWFAYAAVRNAAGNTRLVALDNATRLLDVESALGIDIESAVQAAVAWPQASVAANSYYLLHFPLTLTIMAIAFVRSRKTVFPALRNAVIACTAVALGIHTLMPMAPPRMLPGILDMGLTHGPDPYSLAGSSHANQFAAMPSMHVAWAILCGYAIWQLSRHRGIRMIGVAHPVVTSFVVVLTGHHFVADVAIGAALAWLAIVGTGKVLTTRPSGTGASVSSASASRSVSQ